MAPPQPEPLSQIPPIIAGIMTVKCECGWEMVFIQPEEHIVLMNVVFQHMQQDHHVVMPQLCCFWH